MKLKNLLFAFFSLALSAAAYAATFANGADVGWVSQQESSGYSFYNSSGVKTDPFVLLKNLQVNAIRLRVWVNPSGGWNDGADVLYKAKRAAAQGQRIMIDFHYSDSWADPGQQTKPAAWSSHTLAQLNNDVYSHTQGILNYLKTNGITVEWVQVGNEINGGMLWPEGKTSSFSNLAGLINSGYNATKAMLADLLTKTKALGSNGLGVFYWEPQAYPGWQGYTMGALDASGKFTIALDPF